VKRVGRRFRAVLKAADLEGFKLYDLRHSYASHLLDQHQARGRRGGDGAQERDDHVDVLCPREPAQTWGISRIGSPEPVRGANGLAMVTLNGDLNWRRSEAADIHW
jgi:hypothetical protein